MIRILLSCLACLIGTAALAQTPAKPAADTPMETGVKSAAAGKADPRTVIAKKFPGIKAEDIKISPLPGIYEVAMGSDTAYVSADGRYLINGDLFEVDSRTNLTEANRSGVRRQALAKLDERDMIIFAPAKPTHTITVFTDVECGYCRKLHSEIEQINKLGVRVRYMAYPRAGPGSADWAKMESVWCSKDRKSAITQAKNGAEVKAANCGATPVAQQFELGEKLGVNGTPAVFTDGGDYIGGYLPPQQLVEQLDKLDKVAAATGK
jgi:thiol:disulfide interchange protein DsbC